MTLRGALLGAGNIAQMGHLPAFESFSSGDQECRIVAAADLCDENLSRIAARLPGVQTFGSAIELLRNVRPDFVDICAPPFAHRDLIEQSVAYGCHVLCEKPLAMSLADAEAIAAMFRHKPLVFVPGHQYHFAPAWTEITSAVASGEIGALRFGSLKIERQAANPGNSHWNPSWRTCGELSGGGILMDHGTHLFYQLRSLFGEPTCIQARTEFRRANSYAVEDTADCLIEFSDASVRMKLTWAAERRRTIHRYVGTCGSVVCDETSLTVTNALGSRCIALDGGFSRDSSHADWYVPLIADFVRRIHACDYERTPLDEAIMAVRCTAAAYESAQTRRTVSLARDV